MSASMFGVGESTALTHDMMVEQIANRVIKNRTDASPPVHAELVGLRLGGRLFAVFILLRIMNWLTAAIDKT